MSEDLIFILLFIVIGLSGWLVPYKWNLLRFRRFLGRLLPDRFNRLVPKILGTIFILFGILGLVVVYCFESDAIPPTERTMASGGIQFAYLDADGIVHESNEVPVIEGFSYGWTFLCKEDREYKWKEIFYYPRESNEVGPQTFNTELSEYPSRIEGLDPNYVGVIGHTWIVGGNDDAEGAYIFEVTIDGKQYRFTPQFKRN